MRAIADMLARLRIGLLSTHLRELLQVALVIVGIASACWRFASSIQRQYRSCPLNELLRPKKRLNEAALRPGIMPAARLASSRSRSRLPPSVGLLPHIHLTAPTSGLGYRLSTMTFGPGTR